MASEQIQLQAAVKDLTAANPAARIAAAKALFAAGLREFSGVRKEVLSSDESWAGLLKALTDPEVKVVENAAGAVAQVLGRYRQDTSAFEPMRALLAHKNKQIRMYAARGLGHLKHPERWRTLISVLEDKAEPVRKEAVLAMVLRAKEMSPAEQSTAKEAMERSVAGAGPELKMITENAIRVLG